MELIISIFRKPGYVRRQQKRIIKAIGISTTREIPAKIRTFRIIKVEIVKIMADQISKFTGENFPCLAR